MSKISNARTSRIFRPDPAGRKVQNAEPPDLFVQIEDIKIPERLLALRQAADLRNSAMSLQFEGRTYVLGTVDGIALTCDRCESSIAAGAQVWSCAAFDHDICTRCRPSEAAADPMDDGEEDAGEDTGEDDLTPEEQASKQRRIEAAISRQHRL